MSFTMTRTMFLHPRDATALVIPEPAKEGK